MVLGFGMSDTRRLLGGDLVPGRVSSWQPCAQATPRERRRAGTAGTSRVRCQLASPWIPARWPRGSGARPIPSLFAVTNGVVHWPPAGSPPLSASSVLLVVRLPLASDTYLPPGWRPRALILLQTGLRAVWRLSSRTSVPRERSELPWEPHASLMPQE